MILSSNNPIIPKAFGLAKVLNVLRLLIAHLRCTLPRNNTALISYAQLAAAVPDSETPDHVAGGILFNGTNPVSLLSSLGITILGSSTTPPSSTTTTTSSSSRARSTTASVTPSETVSSSASVASATATQSGVAASGFGETPKLSALGVLTAVAAMLLWGCCRKERGRGWNWA